MKPVLPYLALLAALSGTAHAADTYVREVKLEKGQAKVAFTPLAAEDAARAPAGKARVGIAPSPTPSFGNYLAKELDTAGKVQVVSASHFDEARSLLAGYDSLMRGDLDQIISASCHANSLTHLLLMGAPQTSMKTDVTAYLFLVGRMRMRNTQESRLYDCGTRRTVWVQKVLFETSQGVMSSALTGNGAGALIGGPEAEQAMARLYAEKLTSDMRW